MAAAAMAAHRASFPLRLQQILSGSRAVSPAIKVDSETPAKVKAFIDRVINIPLHDIAIPLSGFRWEFNKGNFHHWKPLFVHFDTYFKAYISSRKDLLLSGNMAEGEPLTKNTILQILRVMQIVLENCQNKSSFAGLEHFKPLLASSDPEIVVAALETLAALVKINPSKLHMNGKLINCGAINSHLLSLAQGWGSKEEGLGLYSCIVANERNQQEGLCLFPADMENKYDGTQHRLGSTLHFEYNLAPAKDYDKTSDKNKSSNLCVIHIPDLHLHKEDDLSILSQCIDKFNVPLDHRFALFTRIRYAHAFNSPRTCRLYSRISLLSFIVLVQSGDAHDELTSFFTNEPEYINELIRLVRSEDIVPGPIRALAMLALGAQLAAYASSHERARILSGSSIISAGGNRMVLLGVLQKAIASLSSPNDTSSPLIVDALLQFFLLHVLSSSSSGTTVRGSGMVTPLLPLLQDKDPSHMHLVCLAVKTLQKLMEYSSPAVSLFKDLGGVELLSQRLHVEVQRVIGVADSLTSVVASDTLKSEDDHLYFQKRLIKALLKALGSATYSPANPARSQSSNDTSLPMSLSLIFQNLSKFGGDIYFSSVTVMSEIIHKDPTCFPALKELGLPDAFLASVTDGVIPSCKALICVPNGLGAICLNNQGLETVRETSALRFLVDAFTSRKYLIPMNEGVVLLANAVEELLRHVQSLRSTGVDIIIEIINTLSLPREDRITESTSSAERTDMETDVEGRDLVSTMDSGADGTNDDQFSHLSIFHVMVLVHRTMENSETCRLFVEKGGLQTLLTLLLRPSITQSSGGMPIALHSTMVFKGFTQQHSTPLARSFCSSLKEHLKNALQELDTVSRSGEVIKFDKGTIPSLFIVEFLLFLAASKDNRWINALLSEFGDVSRDVLEDIGRVHREVLWQISLFEEKKVEPEASSPSVNEAQQADTAVGDSDDNRYTSFRQYLDPLLRRRGSGWNIESQVSDLINIYRDMGRAATDSHRIGADRFPSTGFPSSSQDQPSSSSNANPKSVEEKKKTEHSSCCDMLRSLSYHINHLFMELGKAMLLTARRENSAVNLSPSVVSVASNIASIVLEHLNFEGHRISSEREVTVTTKCRYLGKVVEFIDGILLDRPESCNPVMVNSLYCRGVIQAILTTFEATSELLFAMNRLPSSPMETDSKAVKDEKDTDCSWIYGPLSSYGAIMDHLVTSSFILSSSTRQLLEQPIFGGSVRFPQDAERFMKLLQSKVLKTVLPIWAHPQFPECNIELISSVTSILRHVYSGVEVKNTVSNIAARLAGPPPDENAISLIIEMGFSRVRAEEALRQVGTNSVEIATDWLFSHPEEAPEDDELARALAMSLGNSDTPAQEEDDKSNDLELEEDNVQLPPMDEVLSSCLRLLQTKETLAFPVRDMLMTISSQNDGQNRVKVLTYLIDHLKQCLVASDPLKNTALSALFHVLALILHGDTAAREVVSEAGLVKVALNLLCSWELELREGEIAEVPNWVTSCFLSVDRMLQLEPKLPDVTELDVLKKDNPFTQTPVVIDDSKKSDSESSSSVGLLDLEDQKQLLRICCKCILKQLPSGTMHAILQLCATLTKVHVAAICFLESGGLHALLSLPTSSLFSGFNSVVSTIIRHILEDPHTLQQAMELEIRHNLVTAANRHANPRVTPRNFVQNLSFVVYRDPVIFMKAARAVCQIEMVGDRPYVVLLKDRDKEKSKEKEKDKLVDKDKLTGLATKMAPGDIVSASPVSAKGKQSDSNARSVKSHRKPPQSFVTVIEHLLDLVMSYVPPPRAEDHPDGSSSMDMDIDSSSAKGKGKAVAVTSEESKQAIQEATATLAKNAFVLKLLTDVLLTYASSIQVVLRHDAELSSTRGSTRTTSGFGSGGIFNHILQHFLPHATKQKKERKPDGDWRYKLATRANQFLVASSIRSPEGRKRICSEICSIFVDFTDSSTGCKPPLLRMNAYVDLLNDILSARSPTGSSLSAESVVTFVEVGLVQCLTRTLQVLDLDHPDSAKIVTAIVKALEVVTKEHVHLADFNAKGENSSKTVSEQNNVDSSSNRFQVLDSTSQPTAMVTDHGETFNAVHTSRSTDSVTDEMEHDRDLDGGFTCDGEDDFMHEIADDRTGNESTMDIRFDIPHNREDDMAEDDDDSDEDMSANDGEEVDEDDEDGDEENNNLEEDDAHQISHPDTDQDDREIDEEEFDEDLLEEDDEDDDEEGVILRLEEGINGINVFDHIEVFGGSNNLSGDTLRVMPLDIFGTRRQGRSTSIYNLLGRANDQGVLDHPLLEEPSMLLPQQRQPGNIVELAFSDRNHENSSSRLDAIFRSLRSGRNGHRFNMWLDDGPQRSGTAAPAVPEGIEELLLSQLRRPMPEHPDVDQSTPAVGAQQNDRPSHLHGSETEEREEQADQNENNNDTPAASSEVDGSASAGPAPPHSDEFQRDTSSASEHVADMQYERSDAVIRDVEAVSQASSGSGATLGESLRSLDVEIGSVEGHDDGDRHGASDRIPLGDIQAAARSRRPSGSAIPVSSRDISLESVSEVPQNPVQESDQNTSEGDQEPNRATNTDSIDPTFLEALPEDLRAEVLSSRQNQVTQTSSEQPQSDGDIDPEFLAALPPDIRDEVLAQQRAQRLQQQSQELEGQPVEMDAVSIIATFPSEIREEVLLTSPDTLLATLTPALVAEANMLRERFAHRYNSGSLFGMNSRNRRGESSRRADIIGTSLDRNAGDSSHQTTSKLIETEGTPLVDKDALNALIRLLRVVQPIYKGQLQRLLLNLCAHRESRRSLVQIFVDMLMLDLHGSSKKSIEATEPPFRLYGCHANITYSRPQSSNGVPPLVSRRVLETLTYLARNHPNVARLLLLVQFPCPPTYHTETVDQTRGKAALVEDEEQQKAFALVLLLTLLNQPLYMRSVAHLEQLLNLLEVVMLNAENEINQAKLENSSEKPSGPENATEDAQEDASVAGSSGAKPNAEDSGENPADNGRILQAVLHSLPQAELRLLCSLLAHDGLSDNAYLLVAEVLKKIVALAPFFCCHFINELACSMQNLTLCAMKELHMYEDSEKAILSTSSANGTAILRVVQALSSLVTSLQERKDPELLAEKDHSDALSQISEINTSLDALWLELSNCISKIESSSEHTSNLAPVSSNATTVSTGVAPPLPAGTQNILPYIESFFVTCEKLRPGQPDAVQEASTSDMEDASTSSGGQKSSASHTNLDEKHSAFVKFSEKHRRLLNAFIRQNPGLLEKSFSLMLKIPRLIDFDNKRAYFRSKIKHQHDHHHSPVRISVRRAYILEDSYNQLRMRSPQDLKGRLTVHFQGEEGIDAGGLTREWYQLLSRVIFDKGALLFTTVGNDLTFQPNPNSVYQTEHLSYFKFVGRVVGKALFDAQLLDVHFTRSFYKHILGAKVTYHDIEAIDPAYYRNLKWMLENDISDVLDLTFSMDADEEKLILYEKAEVTDCELIPGGRSIRVTEENKHEYVDRVAEHRLTTAIRPQINAFMEGFNELIPRELISIFNDKEFELLISGLPDIDLDDLKANTEYSGYSIGSPVIQWFWEIVQGFSKEDKARFLQFVTGTSKVPLEGFNALQGISGPQRFQIHKAYGSTNHLPSAHTCFNQLDLPEYTSKDQLRERLLLAIHEANEGFGFG